MRALGRNGLREKQDDISDKRHKCKWQIPYYLP